MNNNKKIKPNLAGGFQNYSQKDALTRKWMINTISDVFERFGFFPLETPAVERLEVLTGGDESFDKQIFKIAQNDNASEKIALRFDLTVPLARFVAENMSDLKFPYKRYQIGDVWRGERQQAGRFKEFMQCDVDIIGSKRMEADAEIIAVVIKVLNELGIKNAVVGINNRKILNGLPEYAKYDEDKNVDVLRVLDKLEKIGWDGVNSELKDKKIALDNKQIDKIKDILNTPGDDWKNMLSNMSKKIIGINVAEEGVSELTEIANNLISLGVPESSWNINFSIARGLSYYTGSVFETLITNTSVGSIASGGRYDNLVERFSPASVPAVGMSIGFDRLFFILQKLDIIQNIEIAPKVTILNFDADLINDVENIATKLRDNNINTELYLGSEKSITGQISYAINNGAKFVIIFGKEEKEKNVVQIKNIETREQEEVKIEKIVEYIINT